MITLSRRKLLGGLSAFIAAPAIVRVASLMPVKALPVAVVDDGFWFNAAEYEALTEQSVARLAAYMQQRRILEEGIRRFWKAQFLDLQANPNRHIDQIVG